MEFPMKLLIFFCVSVMVMLLFIANGPVPAEVYQFTDDNGETHYTNDATSIPRQYQDDMQVEGETVYYYDDEEYEEESEQLESSTGSDEQETEGLDHVCHDETGYNGL